MTLRLLSLRDLTAYVEAINLSRAELTKWLTWLSTDYDPAAYLEAVERDRRIVYAIEDEGDLVGIVALKPISETDAEVSYWVRTDRTGQGIATWAVNELAFIAAVLGYTTLLLQTESGNLASVRVAEKAGFEYDSRRSGHVNERPVTFLYYKRYV